MTDKQLPIAEKLLTERGWLPIYLASQAIVAMSEHDGRSAAHAITQLHSLEDSRAKAQSIAMMNTAIDALIAADPRIVPTSSDRMAAGSPLVGLHGKDQVDFHAMPVIAAASARHRIVGLWRLFARPRNLARAIDRLA